MATFGRAMTNKVLAGEGSSGGLDYTFSLGTFMLMAGGLAVYIGYTLIHSERELKDMVNHVYGPPQPPNGAQEATGGAQEDSPPPQEKPR